MVWARRGWDCRGPSSIHTYLLARFVRHQIVLKATFFRSPLLEVVRQRHFFIGSELPPISEPRSCSSPVSKTRVAMNGHIQRQPEEKHEDSPGHRWMSAGKVLYRKGWNMVGNVHCWPYLQMRERGCTQTMDPCSDSVLMPDWRDTD